MLRSIQYQACKLPLLPGVYGGPDPVVLGPIRHLPPLIAQLIPSGEYDAKVQLHTREGALLTCVYSRVTHLGLTTVNVMHVLGEAHWNKMEREN